MIPLALRMENAVSTLVHICAFAYCVKLEAIENMLVIEGARMAKWLRRSGYASLAR